MAFLGALVTGAARARAGMLGGRQAGEAEGYRRGQEESDRQRAEKKLQEDIAYRLLQQQLREDQLARQVTQDQAAAERYAAQMAETKRANQARESAARERNAITRAAEGRRGASIVDATAKEEERRRREALSATNTQVDDLARDISLEERLAPSQRDFMGPGGIRPDTARFRMATEEHEQAVAPLRNRYQQVAATRDSIANILRQRSAADTPTPEPSYSLDESGRDEVAAAYADAAKKYQRALDNGAPPELAQQAYQTRLEQIGRQFGVAR